MSEIKGDDALLLKLKLAEQQKLIEQLQNPDYLWNALRDVACSTKPSSDAKTIVLLKREHVALALKKIKVAK